MHGWMGRGWRRSSTTPPRQPFTRQLRNVTDRLPNAVASTVAERMRRTYPHADALVAQAELEALAVSWTAPTPAPPRLGGKAWPRPSRSVAWACHRPWPGRCGPRTRSSR